MQRTTGARGRALMAFLALLAAVPACGRGTERAEAPAAPAESRDRSGEGGPFAHTNRLAGEGSPYLRQHAHNPVDWYPWGEEAFARARAENKQILHSIGYSTCHWCRVMAEESFSDTLTAALLNANFIPVKVDREERPDVDMTYQSAVRVLTDGQQGGWPLSVLLTPDLKPFAGGTYFPPEPRGGLPAFRDVLLASSRAWREAGDAIAFQAENVAQQLLRAEPGAVRDTTGAPLDADLLQAAAVAVRSGYDLTNGGFGGWAGAPQFPTPHRLSFLLRQAERSGEGTFSEMVRYTLNKMASGAIHDHVGGGFHRYTTDRAWSSPHFERMLYDQAGLVLAYLEAWRYFGREEYADVARRTADYVLRDLRHPEGGFYTAEDADSPGGEGAYYLWSAAEIDSLLGPSRGPAFRAVYGPADGATALLRVEGWDRTVYEPWAGELDELRAARTRRPHPHRDEKVMAAWNGSMIRALAEAGAALEEPRYLTAAIEAAEFVDARLQKGGRLYRTLAAGSLGPAGFLDDYAHLGRGYLALYEATGDPRWLERSRDLARALAERFPRSGGGFAYVAAGEPRLLLSAVVTNDTEVPSANAAAADLLLRLGHLMADRDLEAQGRGVFQAFSGEIRAVPAAHLATLSALDFALGPRSEIVIAGGDDPATQALWREVRGRYLRNTVTAFRPAQGGATGLIPYLADQAALDGKATAYVCRNYACRLPVHDAAGLAAQLEGTP